jgi:hypothetical protein
MLTKTIVLGILAGTTISAAAIQGVHAQAKAPTYVLGQSSANRHAVAKHRARDLVDSQGWRLGNGSGVNTCFPEDPSSPFACAGGGG